MITDDRIREIVSGEHDLDKASERLIAAANAAGGKDNITVVLARIEPA
jgi:protein phosphatase